MHRRKGDFFQSRAVQRLGRGAGQVPRSTLIVQGQKQFIEWMTHPPVPSPSFILLKPTQHLFSCEWARRSTLLKSPPAMGHDSSVKPQRLPQFKWACSCIDHLTLSFISTHHTFRYHLLLAVPPSALFIMSKSFWALTLGCCLYIKTDTPLLLLKCSWQGRFFTYRLLRGPSHACVCMIQGFTMYIKENGFVFVAFRCLWRSL